MKQLFIALLALSAATTSAQSPNKKLDKQITDFFTGNWHGEGQFANGKKISANISFKLSLDSCWLVNQHTDELPNEYKADSYWGIDQSTGGLTATIFDNFGGLRLFSGVYADSLVLVRAVQIPQGIKYFEHFIYKKMDAGSFNMIYEVSRDSIQWHEGDHLVFKRKA